MEKYSLTLSKVEIKDETTEKRLRDFFADQSNLANHCSGKIKATDHSLLMQSGVANTRQEWDELWCMLGFEYTPVPFPGRGTIAQFQAYFQRGFHTDVCFERAVRKENGGLNLKCVITRTPVAEGEEATAGFALFFAPGFTNNIKVEYSYSSVAAEKKSSVAPSQMKI